MRSPEIQLNGHSSSRRVRGWVYRVNGAFIIISALAAGLLGWLVLSILAANLQKNPDQIKSMADLAKGCINHRTWFSLIALLPLAGGCALLRQPHSRARSLTIIAIAYAFLLAQVGLIIYTFISFLAPLYQYQPL